MALLSTHGFWRHHVAVDVGTATTRVAIGVNRLIERPSQRSVMRALRGGVVVDAETAVAILTPLLARVRVFGVVGPRVLACVPSDAHRDERELLVESLVKAGAATVAVIPEPLAAAVGTGIDVSSPYAHMVVDIGEGVSDCAIIRSSKILATHAVRIGCAGMRQAIMQAGEPWSRAGDAEAALRTYGIAMPKAGSGAALEPVVDALFDSIGDFLRGLPPALGCEIIDSGIRLSGGGALIPGLPERMERLAGISVKVAENPLLAVIEGARSILPVVTALNQWH